MGLGLCKIHNLNCALLAKVSWNLLIKKASWHKITKAKYLNQGSYCKLFTENGQPQGSKIWNSILKSHNILEKGVHWKIGSGWDTMFWEDAWLQNSPLMNN